jgi:hypothetical protein
VIIHVTAARVVGPHSLELQFDDGLIKRINLRHELYGPIFEPLRDPAYFARVAVDTSLGTVTWPNGADFAPDFLYLYESEPQPANAVH